MELRAFAEDYLKGVDQDQPGTSPVPSGRLRIIREGVLLCNRCRIWYPIASYVPVMLVFQTPFHKTFARTHAQEIARLPNYNIPAGQPKPGEHSVQATFTEQWNTLQNDDLSFSYSREDLENLHRKVLLKWSTAPPPDVRNILNVGVGFGVESEVLHKISGAEIYALDLNFSLLGSGPLFREKPFLHLIVGSLFDPPFAEKSFDLVYSQGVLMHTYDTRQAFNSIARFVRDDGRLFIWIDAIEDIFARRGIRGLLTKALYFSSLVVRPVLSRAPSLLRSVAIWVISLLLHPLMVARELHPGKWSLKNTNHHFRDYFTPRYVHMHTFNEVVEWYETLGFNDLRLHSPLMFRRLFGRSLFGIGILGRRMATEDSVESRSSLQEEAVGVNAH
ncbi:MAG: methyltransferase domain-containing protein [Acidobacteria bacterium]|nr:methyltransferase domain-containing protein [Acidobacteriota bacterium]